MADQCRSCEAPIEWAIFHCSGKRVPLNLEPNINGNLALMPEGVRPYTAEDAKLGVPRRTSHLVTCRDANLWRRR